MVSSFTPNTLIATLNPVLADLRALAHKFECMDAELESYCEELAERSKLIAEELKRHFGAVLDKLSTCLDDTYTRCVCPHEGMRTVHRYPVFTTQSHDYHLMNPLFFARVWAVPVAFGSTYLRGSALYSYDQQRHDFATGAENANEIDVFPGLPYKAVQDLRPSDITLYWLFCRNVVVVQEPVPHHVYSVMPILDPRTSVPGFRISILGLWNTFIVLQVCIDGMSLPYRLLFPKYSTNNRPPRQLALPDSEYKQSIALFRADRQQLQMVVTYPLLSSIRVYDVEEDRILPSYSFGKRGSKPMEFYGHLGVAVTPELLSLIVADTYNDRLQEIGDSGTYMRSIVVKRPTRVSYSCSKLYVLTLKPEVEIFDYIGGNRIRHIYATGITAAPKWLFVAVSWSDIAFYEESMRRVVVYESDGSSSTHLGQDDISNDIGGIALGNTEKASVVVCDNGNRRIATYSKASPPSYISLPPDDDGTGDGKTSSLMALFESRMYVVDTYRSRVLIYD